MAVYVDNVKIPWRGWMMPHMTADTVDELHEFAERLGLQRRWAQLPPDHSVPHYDVSEGKRQQAIKMGAIEEDWRSTEAIERHRIQRIGIRIEREHSMAGVPEDQKREFRSTLPCWIVEEVIYQGKKLLGITCTRCGNKAIVSRSWKSTKVNRYGTRTCTYCFRTAIMPHREKEFRNG